jgi:hypothetical protein
MCTYFWNGKRLQCTRENVYHICDFVTFAEPLRLDLQFVVDTATVRDFYYHSNFMVNQGESFYLQAKTVTDVTPYSETACNGRVPVYPDEDVRGYTLKEIKQFILTNHKDKKFLKNTSALCVPPWSGDPSQIHVWRLRCQSGTNIFYNVGKGTIRMFHLLLDRLSELRERYLDAVRLNLSVSLSQRKDGSIQCCNKCDTADVKFEDVAEMALYDIACRSYGKPAPVDAFLADAKAANRKMLSDDKAVARVKRSFNLDAAKAIQLWLFRFDKCITYFNIDSISCALRSSIKHREVRSVFEYG